MLTGNGTLDLRGFTILNAEIGRLCTGRCTLSNGILRDLAFSGVIAENVTLEGMTLVNAGFQDGDGVATIYNYHATITSSTITASGRFGVFSNHVKLVGSSVSGSGIYGVSSKAVRLINSSATANGTNPDCGSADRPCADLAALKRLRLKNSTCGTSIGRGL